MGSKIIIHDGQTHMFGGVHPKHTEPKEDLSFLEQITFENSHLVARYLLNNNPRVADALQHELEAQRFFDYIEKEDNKDA